MKILVTGGAGFVGQALIRELVKNHEVVSLDNYSIGSKTNHVSGADYLEGDINKISELIDQYFANNKKKLLNILNENNFLKEEDIIILRMFLSKLKRLKKIKEQFVNKKNLDTIITNLRPPVFWKDKEILKKQVEQITLEKINHLIKKVTNIELNIKKNPNFSNKIISDFILEN